MGKMKGLSWCLVLLIVVEVHEACVPSSCGNITNIRYPFRLRDDPVECGKREYELACEHNVTVLYLNSAKYYVLGINYSNFTIRLVDPGIQLADCSSLPHYLLSLSNFTRAPYADALYSYRAAHTYSYGEQSKVMFQHIIYLNCSDPMGDNAPYSVDTSPCVNWHSKGYFYAVVGDLLNRDLKIQCRVKFIAPITLAWGSFLHKKRFSYADVHRALSYGFELSWFPEACADHPCPMNSQCFFNPETEKLDCYQYDDCTTPMGIDYKANCGNYSKLRIFAEDFLYGIYKGLRQIKGYNTYHHYSYYDFGLTQLGIDIGVVTGRYVLPYITVRVLLGIIFLFVLLIYTCRRRHLSEYENIEDFLQLHNLMPVRYSYKQIKRMTRGFKDKLGEGGFGTVYKGKLRSGPQVAIKMLGKSQANGQEFISEVATIGRIHHVHVARLVGFCAEGSKRALVYEFMSNGSLDKYIFSKEGSVFLEYDKIYEISLGVARGIAYLHHGCDMQILHFDIKPHNILLDENFTSKISDFGLARLYPIDDSIVTLTIARGTIGYMAPELFYKNIGGVSFKADVYSFGMLLLEMASRRRNSNPRSIEHSSQLYFPLWIYDQFTEEKYIEMKDLTKEEKNLAKKMFIIAFWCIQLNPTNRPSMNKVIEMLEADVESLEMPPKPLLYPHETITEDHEIDSYQTTSSSGQSFSYANDVTLKTNAGKNNLQVIKRIRAHYFVFTIIYQFVFYTST